MTAGHTAYRAPDRILATSRRPESLGHTPPDAVSLAMGEPFADTHPLIVEAAAESLRSGNTRYTQLTGLPALREAIAAHLSSGPPGGPSREPVTPAQVVITHGASGALAASILALVGQGDRVLIPEPTYSLYADQVALAGGEVVWIPSRPDGSLDLARLADEVPTARLLIVCNPGNPTGAVQSAGVLRELAGLLAEVGCLLLSDEAYSDIVFDEVGYVSALDLPGIRDRVLCCGTFSKSFAMTGWRLGWVVADSGVAADVNLVHRTVNGAVNSFVQAAGITALSLSEDVTARLVADYAQRRDRVVAAFSDLPEVTLAVPRGAFYAFPRIRTGVSSDELTARLAAAGVLVRSGREYGPSGEGHIRISFATDVETLETGLARIRATLLADPSRRTRSAAPEGPDREAPHRKDQS